MRFRSGLKAASLFLLIVLVLAVFLIVALMYADPTRLKEQIEAIAQQKGVELQLTGDIDWGIYPNVQLIVQGATANYSNSTMQVDADIDYFSFSLKPWSALRGELEFVGAEIAGAEILLELGDEDSNQSDLGQRLEELSALLPRTSIENLQLKDIKFNTVSEGDTQQWLWLQSLNATDMSPNGIPFAVAAELDLASSSASASPGGLTHIQWDGHLLVNPLEEIYGADFGRLSIGAENGDSSFLMEGFSRANLDLRKNQWSWDVNLADTGIAGFNGNFSGAVSPLAGRGRFEANVGNMPMFFASLDRESSLVAQIKMLAVDADLVVADDMAQFENLRLRIDRNSGRGSFLYGLGEQNEIEANLSFQSLDLDPYFSNARESEGSSASQPSSGLSPELLSSLGSVDDLSLQFSVTDLRLWGQEIKDVHLNAEINEGIGSLSLNQASFAEGEASLSLAANLAGGRDVQDIQLAVQGVQLDQFELQEGGANDLAGALSLSYQGTLQDLSRRQLLEGLQGGGQIAVTDLMMASMNIEEALCRSTELVGATPSVATDWPSGTVLGDISTGYSIQNGIAQVNEFDFDYGNMNVVSDGSLNLLDSGFGISLLVKVNGEKTSASGCNLNKYAQRVELPLQCTGSLGGGTEMSCGVDANIAERLVLQQVGGQLIESVLGRLADDESAGDESPTGDSDPDDARREELRALLEGMLNDIDN